MDSNKKVYLAMPTYDNRLDVATFSGVITSLSGMKATVDSRSSSLLAHCFNRLWSNAVCSNYDGDLNVMDPLVADYFMMIHADVGPLPGMLPKLIDELEEHDADVMAATLPIKDDGGGYSVALMETPDSPASYRLTEEHYHELPSVYDGDDLRRVSGMDGIMGVNTGLWCCRLGQAWNRQVAFQIRSGITWHDDGDATPWVISEDWDFSMQCERLGLRVMGTKNIPATHSGIRAWRNWTEDTTDAQDGDASLPELQEVGAG